MLMVYFLPQWIADIIEESPSNNQQISGLLGGTMQIVFDFIAGDIPFDEFWDAYCADPKIGEWLDSIADFAMSRRRLLLRITGSAHYTVQ